MSDSTNITDTGDATLLTLSNQNATNVSWVDLASSGATAYITSDSTANISLIDPNQYRHVTPNRGSQSTDLSMWIDNTTPLSNVTYFSNAPDSNSGIPGEIFHEPSGNMWVKSSQGWKMITPQWQVGVDPFEPTVVEKGEKRKLKCFK